MNSLALTAPARARDLVALTKPRITLLNLIAATAGYWLAPFQGSAASFVGMLLGTGLVVGSANALNCYLERDLDGLMSRTRTRPLPAGRVAPMTALVFAAALATVGIPLIAAASHLLAAFIAALALVAYVFVYTPLKQRTSLALLVGAVPGAAPPLIGWAAATGTLHLTGVLLFALLFLWQVPHFLAITLYRKEEYAAAGFRVAPVEHGEQAARAELFWYALAMVATSFSFAMLGEAGWLYLGAAALLGAALLRQAAAGLRPEAGAKWARAFFMSTNLYLTVLLATLVLDRFLF